MNRHMSQMQANVLFIITSFISGAGFVASLVALDADFTPLQLIAGRFFVASGAKYNIF